MFRFIGAAILAAVVVVAASVVWPAVSGNPRPFALERVHEVVASNQVGRQVDTAVMNILPQDGRLSAGSVAGVAVSHIVESVGENAKQAAVKSAIDQVLTQWDAVPEAQKDQIREKICR